jgi:hypothetical protein
MKLNPINDKAKCAGQSEAGSHVCADRGRCGRYLRPTGDYQTWEAFWKAGDACQKYEIVPGEYHIVEFDEKRIDVIGANGNDGLHYAAA